MVRACLRVLKHHKAIALVSPFSYSNRYEFTPRAAAMLAGKEPKLLQEALEFCWKRRTGTTQPQSLVAPVSPVFHSSNTYGTYGISGTSLLMNNTHGSYGSSHPTHQPVVGSPYSSSLFGFTPSSSYPPRGMGGLSASQRRMAMMAVVATNSLEKETSPAMRKTTTTTAGTNDESRPFQMAIAELYCACSRNISFGDLWLALTHDSPPSSVVVPPIPSQTTVRRYGSGGGGAGAPGAQQQQQHNRGPSNFSSRRRGSISQEYPDEGHNNNNNNNNPFPTTTLGVSLLDSLALSPSESHHLESLRRTANYKSSGAFGNESSVPLDWKDVFKRMDHRRFITFGLIHGLITRIHAYPCFPYPFPDPPPQNSATAAAAGTEASTLYPPTETTTTTTASSLNVSDVHFHSSTSATLQQHLNSNNHPTATAGTSGAVIATTSGSGSSSSSGALRDYAVAHTVASRMDGTRCDDELACAMELSFRRLIDLVETYGHRKPICLYAERPDS